MMRCIVCVFATHAAGYPVAVSRVAWRRQHRHVCGSLPPTGAAEEVVPDASLMRYAMRVRYDGTEFAGWQRQPRVRTVQGDLEKALARRFGMARVRTIGASRTDAGVHARGNVAQADLPLQLSRFDGEQLAFQLNRMLPSDVQVFDIRPAPPPEQWQDELELPWHAIVNAISKRYIYRLHASQKRVDPLERLYRADVGHGPMCLARLDEVLQLFVGEHDFAAFTNNATGQDPNDRDTRRHIRSISVLDEGEGDASIEFVLDGALYKMVRNVVGTAVAYAKRQKGFDLDRIAQMLRDGAHRGENKAKPAPAHGLVLDSVLYKNY